MLVFSLLSLLPFVASITFEVLSSLCSLNCWLGQYFVHQDSKLLLFIYLLTWKLTSSEERCHSVVNTNTSANVLTHISITMIIIIVTFDT